MAKLRINGDSSGYVDLEAPNAASSSTLDLDQVPQKNVANTFSAVNNFTGNVGINRSTPQSKFEAWTGNGELSHFGSNNANANNNYTGISLGYAESGANSNYRKVGIVAVGRGDGAARQDLAFLVDSNADGNSVDLNDTKMRISHEGYVTTPQQPGFQFWNNGSDFAISAGGKVTCFYAGDHNIGSHFDASNQRFTAPVSGYYLFGGHLRIGAPGKIRVARFQIYLNGSRLRDLMSVGGTNDYDGSTGYDHPGASGTAVQYLTVGDYVEMYVDAELSSSNTVYIQGGSNSNRKSYWFGHLLG